MKFSTKVFLVKCTNPFDIYIYISKQCVVHAREITLQYRINTLSMIDFTDINNVHNQILVCSEEVNKISFVFFFIYILFYEYMSFINAFVNKKTKCSEYQNSDMSIRAKSMNYLEVFLFHFIYLCLEKLN